MMSEYNFQIIILSHCNTSGSVWKYLHVNMHKFNKLNPGTKDPKTIPPMPQMVMCQLLQRALTEGQTHFQGFSKYKSLS